MILLRFIQYPFKLLTRGEIRRVGLLVILWLTGLLLLALVAGNALIKSISYYLYMNMTATILYRTSITHRWQKACEAFNWLDNHNRPLRIIKVKQGIFKIKASGYSTDDLGKRQSQLSDYLKVEVHTIKRGQRFGTIDIYYGRKDLPVKVRFQPKSKFEDLVLGYGQNGYRHGNLQRLVHIGIAGLPGSGKSVLLRGLITQILLNYERSVIVGIDFKQGSEFHVFERYRNFVLCEDHETSAIALKALYREYERRAAYIKAQNKENAYDLNGHNGERVHPIFVIIDEAAEFFARTDTPTYQTSILYIDKLARLARFAGIHLIIATQRPSVDAIPPQIRSMLSTRIALRMRQKEDSLMFVNSTAALELPDVPGRFLLSGDDGSLEELQAMWLSKDHAFRYLDRIVGKGSSAQLYVHINDLLRKELAAAQAGAGSL